MAFEKRKGSSREYYYVGTRVGKKVIKTYLGRRGDVAAELARFLMTRSGRRINRAACGVDGGGAPRRD